MIEQRAVAVRRLRHFLDQPREERQVVGVDLGLLLDVVRVVLVVRDRVVRLGHANPGIGARARLARDLHAADPRDVGLVAEQQQIEQQLGVLVELLRHAGRLLDGRQRRCCVVGLGLLDPLLDLADRARGSRSPMRRSLAPRRFSRRPKLSVTESRMLRSFRICARRAVDAAAIAEHPLEHDARIALVGQRRVGRAP